MSYCQIANGPPAEHLGGGFGGDPGIESSRVFGSACSCLAGEDAGGAGVARVAFAFRYKPLILVGMPEKLVNMCYELSDRWIL